MQNREGVREISTGMQREVLEVIQSAVKYGASDIHVGLEDGKCIIRIRVHGIMFNHELFDEKYGQEFVRAAFNLSDITEANDAQLTYAAGRISSKTRPLPPAIESVRLQFNPLANKGRYLVMRLHYKNPAANMHDLDALGYNAHHVRLLSRLRNTPTGMILFAGPTGSGKSTSNRMNLEKIWQEKNGEVAILSVEDPPEARIRGVKQIPVSSAQGSAARKAKFDEAISSALRSDPDIIMIGEIRDLESANLAIQASMTGHQVWTTLHANDAMSVPGRLKDIGVADYKVYDHSAMIGLCGQRLVKKLCPQCRVPVRDAAKSGTISEDLLEEVNRILKPDRFPVYSRGPGCKYCIKGIVGRTAIAEVLIPDERFMTYLRVGDKTLAREYWIHTMDGFTMFDHALTWVAMGLIGPEEYLNVLGEMIPPSKPSILEKIILPRAE
ncbi:MAG: GspE/PulE family protein [Alphaproteobacteria bacterium]